ncbi:MAG TPA: hypothetical protein VEB66_05830 [Opitutaceae bacterium]|nr:hypothetical protein [Opitutaceae bacterium]
MKRFYLARSARERVLLLAFALVGLAWWAPMALGRWGALRRDLGSVRAEEEVQRIWFSRRADIEARATAAAGALDPAKTLDAAQAFAELNRLAAGLNAEIAAQRSERSEQFALHTVQVTVRRADLASLVRFYEQITARAPYLAVEQCSLSVDRSTPGVLSAVIRVYSIEALAPAG